MKSLRQIIINVVVSLLISMATLYGMKTLLNIQLSSTSLIVLEIIVIASGFISTNGKLGFKKIIMISIISSFLITLLIAYLFAKYTPF